MNVSFTNLVLIIGYLHYMKHRVEREDISAFEWAFYAGAETKHPTRKRYQSKRI